MQIKKVEIDQSVRVEELQGDTILAIANKEFQYAARFPGRLKRQLHEFFRARGMRKKFGPWVFAVAITKLLQYPGYERDILTIIQNVHPKLYISFTSIGKNSPAHKKAYFAFQGKEAVEVTFRYSDFSEWVESNQKDWRTVTPRVYEDSPPKTSL